MILYAAAQPVDKEDEGKKCDGQYIDPVNPDRSFTFEGASIEVQGTSSQYYYVKNYKIKFKTGFTLADGTGTAPITWIAKELLLTNQAMNPALVTNEGGTYQLGTGGIGGWRDSYIRSYLQETILPLIPEKVRNRIAVVSKTPDAYNESGAVVSQTTEDRLWLPDASELTSAYSALFPTQLSLKKTKPESDTYEDWWTRSVGANAPKAWTLVWADGMIHDNYGNMLTQYAEAIPLCFCTK